MNKRLICGMPIERNVIIILHHIHKRKNITFECVEALGFATPFTKYACIQLG
jgi:hypothetical protein